MVIIGIYEMGCMPSALCIVSPAILTTALRRNYYCHAHLMDEKPEAQRATYLPSDRLSEWLQSVLLCGASGVGLGIESVCEIWYLGQFLYHTLK